MKPNIVATLGNQFDYSDKKLVEEMLSLGISYFRFNLSKYEDEKSLLERINVIYKLKRDFLDEIQIMLDLPFPGRKPRLYIDKNVQKVSRGEKIVLSSDDKKKYDGKGIYVDINLLGQKVSIGKDIIYADGEGSFKIANIIDDDNVVGIANNDFNMYNTKSLSFNYFEKNDEISDRYKEILSQADANSVALSFVTNKEEVERIKKSLEISNIISKVESQQGIDNIDAISMCSNIMLGRGDLCLNSDYYRLYDYQKRVSEKCRKNNSKLYFATGVLSSLINQTRPSQADIIDVSNMIMLKPDYIIFNYALVLHNCKSAVETIMRIYEIYK